MQSKKWLCTDAQHEVPPEPTLKQGALLVLLVGFLSVVFFFLLLLLLFLFKTKLLQLQVFCIT